LGDRVATTVSVGLRSPGILAVGGVPPWLGLLLAMLWRGMGGMALV